MTTILFKMVNGTRVFMMKIIVKDNFGARVNGFKNDNDIDLFDTFFRVHLQMERWNIKWVKFQKDIQQVWNKKKSDTKVPY